MKKQKRIFQIEIAVAALLIALLWLGAVYKIGRLKDQAQQGLSAKNQARLADAIAVYRGDNQGRCPDNLEDLLKDHIEKIPFFYTPMGGKSGAVKNGSFAQLDGAGGWLYVNDPLDSKYCTVQPNFY